LPAAAGGGSLSPSLAAEADEAEVVRRHNITLSRWGAGERAGGQGKGTAKTCTPSMRVS
jgi:hypothetical protein